MNYAMVRCIEIIVLNHMVLCKESKLASDTGIPQPYKTLAKILQEMPPTARTHLAQWKTFIN